MINVLVAEDSLTARELIGALLRADPDVTVVGEARDGQEAVDLVARLRPDVVTMDVRMPRLDGFEATKRIMTLSPTPIVVVSADVDVHDVRISMEALHAGALAVLPKPRGPAGPDFAREAAHFTQTVKAMAGVKVVRRWAARTSPVPRASRPLAARARAVAMAASTGGPAALRQVLGALPRDFAAPILVVQHIAKGFVEGFAAWLDSSSALSVRVARHGESLEPGTAYVAPDDAHLTVTREGLIALVRGAPLGGFRPSATALFESVARAYGEQCAAVILTGMGRDGVDGLRAVHVAGGYVLAQDERTSVVWGMPGAALAAGVVDLELPLDAIAPRLREIV